MANATEQRPSFTLRPVRPAPDVTAWEVAGIGACGRGVVLGWIMQGADGEWGFMPRREPDAVPFYSRAALWTVCAALDIVSGGKAVPLAVYQCQGLTTSLTIVQPEEHR